MDNNQPVVSVCMVSYNQEKYIGTALDSVLAQKCNFTYEVLIGDDFSKDNTRKILTEYAEKYPGVIIPILHPKNLGYQGQVNFVNVLEQCRGKYIAVLEGDDLWADPYKLQKQFDFMEANPDFIMCFSEVNIINDAGGPFVFAPDEPPIYSTPPAEILTIEDVILCYRNMMPTPTLFFRNQLPTPLPGFFSTTQNGDIALQFLIAQMGKIKYFTEKMGSYRNHSTSITKTQEHIDNFYDELMQLYNNFDKYYKYAYTKLFRTRLLELSRIRLIDNARHEHGINRVKHYFRRMPDYLKYSEKIDLKELLYYHLVLFFPSMLKKIRKPSEKSN